MKKAVLLSSLFISILLLSSALITPKKSKENKPGIEFFEGTWASALAQARKENKLVFLDAYAVWCRPCKLMKRTTFKDPAVAAYFNKNFINVEMDMERGEGKRLAKKLALRAYPTLFFINGKEQIIKKTVGALNVDSCLSFGKSVINK